MRRHIISCRVPQGRFPPAAEARNPSGSENIHGLLATYRNHPRCLGPPVHLNRRCAYQAHRETVFRSGWRFQETGGKCLSLPSPLDSALVGVYVSGDVTAFAGGFGCASAAKTTTPLSTAMTSAQAQNENASRRFHLASSITL